MTQTIEEEMRDLHREILKFEELLASIPALAAAVIRVFASVVAALDTLVIALRPLVRTARRAAARVLRSLSEEVVESTEEGRAWSAMARLRNLSREAFGG